MTYKESIISTWPLQHLSLRIQQYIIDQNQENNVFGRTDPGEAGMGILKQSKNRKVVDKGVEYEKEVGQYTVGPEATAVAVVAATLIIVQEVAVVLVKAELEDVRNVNI